MDLEFDDDQMLLISQYFSQFASNQQEASSENSKPRRRRRKKRGDDIDGAMMTMRNKRKLSEEQVNMLEKSFGSEHKLETERKDRLAAELGLDPRQVAVWFQNRRARWRSKRLEEEYARLRSEHDTTVVEKCHLETEILKIKEQLHDAEKEIRRLSERSESLMSNSPIGSSLSMDAMEPFFLGEFGMDGLENAFYLPEDYNYVNDMEWNNIYYI